MAITSYTTISASSIADLDAQVALAIADDKQPYGQPYSGTAATGAKAYFQVVVEGGLSATFEDLDDRVTALEASMTTAQTDINTAEAAIDVVEAAVADHEDRIVVLEA